VNFLLLGAEAPLSRIFQPRCVFTFLIGLRASASVIGAISAENAAFSQEAHRDEYINAPARLLQCYVTVSRGP
jgi:hypothetical protein